MHDSEIIFALDIGTRKVAGLLAARKDGRAEIKAYAVYEHSDRSMLDGQVHLIDKVAEVVLKVKGDLEKQSGITLTQAHVAAAGRSLLTQENTIQVKLPSREPLTRQQVLALELKAVKEAKTLLNDPRTAAGMFSVGHTVIRYVLDGRNLQSLEGHQGESVEVSIIATFMPRIVLDSLGAVLRGCELSMASLTLEPIAALGVAVPADLRRLNLALVDVGAGTSDIALTRAGEVRAFAMVPFAGDEVTEKLSETFLLDFNQGERLKRGLSAGLIFSIQNVFGEDKIIRPEEALAAAQSAVAEWCHEVAGNIFRINGGKPPQAVLLVGGGSQVPGMLEGLAEALGISATRVGHRPARLQREFVNLPSALDQLWAVTPLGIAFSALNGKGLPFAHYRVNEQRVQVLNINDRITAFDALLAAGKDLSEFYGRPGLALSYTFNGELRSEKGEQGTAARLFINGQEASFDQTIVESDALQFLEARAGADGQLTVAGALKKEKLEGISYVLNGVEKVLTVEVRVNGEAVTLDDFLPDRAALDARLELSLEKVLSREGYDLHGLISRNIAVRINGEPRVLTQRNFSLKVNNSEARLDSAVHPRDRIDFEPGLSFQERIRDLWTGPAASSVIRIKVNGQWRQLTVPQPRISMNGREVSADEFLINGAEIFIEGLPERTISLDDLLVQVPQKDISLHFIVNGEPVSRDIRLQDGFEVLIQSGS
jgi:cell division ATPase FtsA